jgi:hypothetical protein
VRSNQPECLFRCNGGAVSIGPDCRCDGRSRMCERRKARFPARLFAMACHEMPWRLRVTPCCILDCLADQIGPDAFGPDIELAQHLLNLIEGPFAGHRTGRHIDQRINESGVAVVQINIIRSHDRSLSWLNDSRLAWIESSPQEGHGPKM